MVIGDAVYPNILHVDEVPVKAALVFVKGELATIDAGGFLVKMTTTKILGIFQVRNAITGGSGDGDVTVSCNIVGSRILVVLPASAKKGDYLQINGADGVNDVVVSAATVDTANLGLGRLFGLYRNTAIVSSANDLGLVDLGVGV
jgi:hypothetical protein